jgi:hypothetical protein
MTTNQLPKSLSSEGLFCCPDLEESKEKGTDFGRAFLNLFQAYGSKNKRDYCLLYK